MSHRATFNRRRFISNFATAVGGAVFTNALCESVSAAAENAKKIEIIDTHTHFYDPTRPQGVPWPGKDDKLLYRPVLPKHYKEMVKGQGVVGTVVIEASPLIEDNQWLLDLAKNDRFLRGIVGRLPMGTDKFAKLFERFEKNPVFIGVRIGHDELQKGLGQARFLDDLKALADEERGLDVNGGPEMPADVAKLAQQVRGLRIVINHAANLRIDGKRVPHQWLEGMREAARFSNVYCKVSALVEGTGRADGKAPREVEFYKPVLDALWNVFGADRLVYGSNWPVSERFAPYSVVQSIVWKYFETKGDAALQKFFNKNPRAAYNWPIR